MGAQRHGTGLLSNFRRRYDNNRIERVIPVQGGLSGPPALHASMRGSSVRVYPAICFMQKDVRRVS
jgi:hypothetical protein